MRLELSIVVDEGGEAYVFVRRAPAVDEFRATWRLWEEPEIARAISDAVAAELDALQGAAAETMRTFFREAGEKLADDERGLDEQARRAEWSA